MDISKITQAPWHVEKFQDDWIEVTYGPADNASERYSVTESLARVDAEFIALARNAFDVMVRRKWNPILYCDGTWGVQNYQVTFPKGLGGVSWPDPFTALVEADKWYNENVESKP